MHGRKRQAAGAPPPSAEALAAAAAKLATFTAVSRAALAARAARGAAPPAALELNAKVAAASPDVLTLWNHRREMLEAAEDEAAGGAGGEAEPVAAGGETAAAARAAALRASLPGELALTAAAIARAPKSYPAWFHRRWAVGRALPLPGAVDVPAELALCARLLDADERNFHCWGYRAWLAAAAGVPPAEELAFTAARIGVNFSNYSAWHRRSVALRAVHAAAGAPGARVPLAVLEAELAFVRRAAYTEPDDQSPWVFRRWLVAQVWAWVAPPAPPAPAPGAPADAPDAPPPHDAAPSPDDAAEALRLLRDDARALRELCALEEGAKWPAVALAGTAALLQSPAARRAGGGGGGGADDDSVDDVPALYARLARMDPRHAAYYAREARLAKEGRVA